MLPAWYFTTCVHTLPADAKIFLSILDSLQVDAPDDPMYSASLRELRRLNLQLLSYAVPSMLAARRQIAVGYEKNSADALRDCWDRLRISLEGRENFAAIGGLLDALRQPTSDDCVVESLTACLQGLSLGSSRDERHGDFIDEHPYSPIHLDLGPALALFVAADLANVGVIAGSDEVVHEIQPVIESALQLRWGRFAYLAAIEVSSALGRPQRDNSSRLRERMQQDWKGLLLYEPNLAWTYQRLVFADSVLGVTGLENELSTFALYNELNGALSSEDTLNNRFFSVRNLPVPTSSNPWPEMVWQTGLWFRLAELDPKRAANQFLELWRPREGHSQPIPWMHWAKTKEKKWKRSIWTYPNALNPVDIPRFTCAVILATRVVRALVPEPAATDEHRECRSFLWLFLLHASHVHDTSYSRLIKAPSKDDTGAVLNERLTLAALLPLLEFAHSAANRARCARIECLTPDQILESLDSKFDKWDLDPGVRRFRSFQAPTVLIQVLYDGYPGACETGKGPDRWLNFIPTVLDRVLDVWAARNEDGVDINISDLQRIALLYRYIHGADETDKLLERTANADDRLHPERRWPNAQEQWLMRYYQIFLLHNSPLARWWPSNWLEPDWSDPGWAEKNYPAEHQVIKSKSKPHALVRLVRAVQRLAAWRLATDEERDQLSEGQRKQCLTECFDLLCATQNPLLDRLVVLRLHELVLWEETHKSPEGLIALLDLFLRSTRAFDIARLTENALRVARKGTQAPDLFRAAGAALHAAYHQMREAVDETLTGYRSAKMPQAVVHEIMRRELLHACWLRLAGAAHEHQLSDMKDVLRSVVIRHRRAEARQQLVVEHRQLEIRRNTMHYRGSEIPFKSIHGAVMNYKTGRIALAWQRDEAIQTPPTHGEIRRFEIRESVSGDRRVLVMPEGWGSSGYSVDMWDPDLSRSFESNITSWKENIPCRYDAFTQRWEPVMRGMIDLVADTFLAEAPRVWLTYVGPGEDDSLYRFATRPGIVYELALGNFTDKAAAELKSEIAKWSSLRGRAIGLRISVEPVGSPEFRLALSDNKIENGVVLPFDVRNLVWRELFTRQVVRLGNAQGAWSINVETWLREWREAEEGEDYDGGGPDATTTLLKEYTAKTLPGFPVEIIVRPRGRAQGADAYATFGVKDRPAAVRRLEGLELAFVGIEKLSAFSSETDRLAFVRTWTADSLRNVECKIEVKGQHRGSFVQARTRESIGVFVDAGSVALEPATSDELGERVQRRRAIVYKWSRRQAQVDLEFRNELPWDDGSELTALIAAAPGSQGQRILEDAVCTLWILRGNSVYERQATIQNYNELREKGTKFIPRCGARVKITRTETGIEAVMDALSVNARPVWTKSNVGVDAGAVYIGRDDRQRMLALSKEPGEIVELDANMREPAYFSRFDGQVWKDGIASGEILRLDSRNQVSTLEWKGRYFYARVQNSVESGNVTLTSLKWQRKDHNGGFSLEPIVTVSSAVPMAIRLQSREEKRDDGDWLKEYQRNPYDVEVALVGEADEHGQLVELKVERGVQPLVPTSEGKWTKKLIVPPDHVPYLDTHERGSKRLQAPVARLLNPRGEWFASFKETKPLGLKDYIEACSLGENPEEADPRSLVTPLYYAGPIQDRPGKYRFEFAPGRILELSEDELSIKDVPFSQNRFIYIGDKFKRARIQLREVASAANDDPAYRLDLEDIDSAAYDIRDEAKRHKLVHFIKVRLDKSNDEYKVVITAIEGIEQRGTLTQSVTKRSHTRVSAILDEASEARMRNRLATRDKAEALIAARVKIDESERGNLVFGHVRCSFQNYAQTGDTELFETKCRLMLTVSGLSKTSSGNDRLLRLALPEDLEDVGDDFKNIVIKSRSFSVYSERLFEIAESGANLKDHRYVVTLEVESSGALPHASNEEQAPEEMRRRRVKADLAYHPLIRQANALRGTLTGSRNAILAYYFGRIPWDFPTSRSGSHESAEVDVYEVYPGIFVGIPAITTADKLQKGAAFRISLDGSKFKTEIAAFGDERYIPERGRPVVALPKDYVHERFSPQRRLRQRTVQFAIGDFRQTVATWAGAIREGSPTSEFESFMVRAHPKIAWLRGTQLSLIGAIDTFGRLELKDGHLYKVALDGRCGQQPVKLAWEHLSYRDAGVGELTKSIQRAKWTYRENKTAQWTPLPDAAPGSEQELPKSEITYVRAAGGLDGPYDFDLFPGAKQGLRYTAERLATHGLSYSAFRQTMLGANGNLEAVVIRFDETERSLWIELSPGRIVELPVVRFQFAAGGARYAMDEFAWGLMAAGDRLTIALTQRDVYDVEWITISQWTPGPRGAFGVAENVFLPGAPATDAGALDLGGGIYVLRYPSDSSALGDGSFRLGANNLLERIPSGDGISKVAIGDIVFLTERENILEITGLTEGNPWPAEDEARWESCGFVNSNLDARGKLPEIAKLVRAVGGFLPVRVVKVERDRRHCVVEFSLENLEMLPGLRTGNACGLDSAGRLVLRAGGKLDVRRVTDIVAGLDREPWATQKEVAQCLIDHSPPVWWRDENTGIIRDDDLPTFDARVLAVVHEVDGQSLAGAGLLMRSLKTQRLLWVATIESTFADLDRGQFAQLFNALGNHVVRVHRFGEPGAESYSLVRTPQVQAEFGMADVGKELNARIEWRYGDSEGVLPRFVVRCTSSGVLFTLLWNNTQSPAPSVGDERSVEIGSRTHDVPIEIVTFPHGRRPVPLDLPESMCTFAGAALRVEVGTDFADRSAKEVLESLHKAYHNKQWLQLGNMWAGFRRRALRSKHVEVLRTIGWKDAPRLVASAVELRRRAVCDSLDNVGFAEKLSALARFIQLRCQSQQTDPGAPPPEDTEWLLYADALLIATGSYSNDGRIFDFTGTRATADELAKKIRAITPVTTFLSDFTHAPRDKNEPWAGQWAEQLEGAIKACGENLELLGELPETVGLRGSKS